MGFSVSGSAAIIFLAALIGFGTLYTASANSAELITDAREANGDRLLEQRNTAINLTDASYDAGSDTLTVRVNNTGTTTLAVNDTDLVADNAYASANASVEGANATDLWLPGETLVLNASLADRPDRVKVVAGPGIAETEVV